MPTHTERRFLPHTADQLYDLVSDVEDYPDFLPWCVGLRVTGRDKNVIRADMIVGFKMLPNSSSIHS